MFVDCDMFMRLSGGGIGHKVTDHLQQRTPTGVHNEAPNPHDEVPDPHNKDIIPYNTPDHTQAEEEDVDRDPKEVDTNEEADYRYTDSPKSEGKDSEGEDGKGDNSEGKDGEGKDSEGEEETNADTGDDKDL